MSQKLEKKYYFAEILPKIAVFQNGLRPGKVVLNRKSYITPFQNFCPIQKILISEGVRCH